MIAASFQQRKNLGYNLAIEKNTVTEGDALIFYYLKIIKKLMISYINK